MSDHIRVLSEVDQMSASGDRLAAIAVLEAANRKESSPVFEQRIVDLRIQAFGESRSGVPQGAWPPVYQQQFESGQGLPEITPQQFDAESLKAGILGCGGLIVRGLMGAERVQQMRDNIDRALQAREDFKGGADAADVTPWFSQSTAIEGGPAQFGGGGGSMWAANSPRVAIQLIDFYKEIGLPGILADYFGEAAVLSVKKWVLRRVSPNNGNVAGWHQDGRFLGKGIRTVNMWVALTDCGAETSAPGMDIVANSEREIFPTGTHGAPFDWTVGQGLVDEIGRTAQVLNPRFYPGDILFFDHYNLHRTGFGQQHTDKRYALESWFFAESRAPKKQIPIVL